MIYKAPEKKGHQERRLFTAEESLESLKILWKFSGGWPDSPLFSALSELSRISLENGHL